MICGLKGSTFSSTLLSATNATVSVHDAWGTDAVWKDFQCAIDLNRHRRILFKSNSLLLNLSIHQSVDSLYLIPLSFKLLSKSLHHPSPSSSSAAFLLVLDCCEVLRFPPPFFFEARHFIRHSCSTEPSKAWIHCQVPLCASVPGLCFSLSLTLSVRWDAEGWIGSDGEQLYEAVCSGNLGSGPWFSPQQPYWWAMVLPWMKRLTESLLIMVSTLVFFLCDKSSIDKTNSYFSFKVEDVQLPVATLDFVSAANFSVP